MTGKFSLYEVQIKRIGLNIEIEVERLLAKDLEYSEAFQEASELAPRLLADGKKTRIREQA